MTTTTADIATLEAKADKAREALERAQEAAEAARRAEQARRDDRARQIDEQVVNEYDDDALSGQTRRAREELARVVAQSDIGKALLTLQLAELRHTYAAADAIDAAMRLGRPTAVRPRPAGNVDLGLLAEVLDQAARDAIATELDERDERRAARIDGSNRD